MLGHRQNEIALVRLQAFEEGVELVEHGWALTVSQEGGKPDEDSVALSVEIAEMDPTHAGWRAMVLEMAWHGIGGRPS